MDQPLEYLTINETHALLKAVSETRDKAIITLFLNTGLFVNELIDLTVNDISFDNKTLTINAHRKREIPLNEESIEALAKWTKERLETPDPHFFITTKGKVQKLSMRNIDKQIRKYADRASLTRNVNAKILRNTFAINLFSKDISFNQASAILGITDPESIKRYAEAAKIKAATKPNLDHIDNRSTATKLLDKIFPTKPKIIKRHSTISATPDELIIGRDNIIKEISNSLIKTQSILITGQLGIGKSHILNHIAKNQHNAVLIHSPVPIKDMLKKIDMSMYPDTSHSPRTSTNEILEHITHNANADFPILIIDDMSNLKTTDIPTMLTLLEHCPILAATEETEPRLKQLWWKFRPIELKPLDTDSCKTLIQSLTQNLSISDYELMETKLLTFANGIPLSITDMVKQLSYNSVVTRDAIRKIYHEAGIKYRDWTPAIIILWALLIMSRFIALGTHSFEGYILVGFGTSFFLVVKYFMGKMK